MISYYDGQLTDIVPGNIAKKPEVCALSHALKCGTQLLYHYYQKLYIYFDIDEQAEEILDLLAAEFRTQYYSSDLNIDVKRRLVKNSLVWYMSAGTPAAVEELVSAVFEEGEVSEWFEYGDSPFYFKIKTDAALTPDINHFFINMIQKVKNTRSHLRTIEIHRIAEHNLHAGVGQHRQYKMAAIMENPIESL